MPCAAGRSEAPAAEAVRARLDWQDALARELTAPGFEAAVLSEVRPRLLTGPAALLLCETMWTLCRAQRRRKATGRQRTDSTQVVAAIQPRNRLECVGATLRQALTVLATAAPDWRQAWGPAAWCERYSRRFAAYRRPPERPARYALAEHLGTDGHHLLWALSEPATPAWLREMPAIQLLRQVWLQQFYAPPAGQPVRWRRAEDLPPAPLLISSPDDPDARYGTKRETDWTGDKVHVPEPGDDETPHRLPAGTPTPATTSDFAVLPTMQAHLATRQGTPGEP
jgi:transposase